ncbi:unnamed protein product [Allacma fusca]|uniref:Reverse transcriptase domain-containing protein n=1 Tax=Allacma fusca TaxID=39272 RepID=A0A8J2PD61_9HEXA|nr:unnamed protein product [Allacma fusca]
MSNLCYADDTTLIASSVKYMTSFLKCLEEVSAKYGLLINKAKTKIMIVTVNQPENNSLEIQEIEGIEVVSQFVYLGSIVDNKGGSEAEIRHRVQITRSAMSSLKKIWSDTAVSKTLKIRLENASDPMDREKDQRVHPGGNRCPEKTVGSGTQQNPQILWACHKG